MKASKQERLDARDIAHNHAGHAARLAARMTRMAHGRAGQQRNNADRYAQVERMRQRLRNVIASVRVDGVGQRARHG